MTTADLGKPHIPLISRELRGKMRFAALWAGLLACLLGTIATGAAAFGRGDKGTTGAQFLKLPPGARQAGMGEAFGGVADDVYAAYYNPAGLGFLKKVEVAAMHNSHFQGVSHNYGSMAVPMLSWADSDREVNELGVLAFSLTSLTVGDIERRGVVETDSPEGTFGASDFAYSLSYGLAFSPSWAVGATAKVIDQSLDTVHATAGAVDLGLLYRRERLTWGFGLRNAGTEVKFRSQGDPLPLLLHTGAGVRALPDLLLAADLRLPRDNAPGFSLGTEYARKLESGVSGALRAGYNSSNTDPDGLTGVTLGAGLGVGSFAFDFAWVPFGDLGNTFRYSLTVKF